MRKDGGKVTRLQGLISYIIVFGEKMGVSTRLRINMIRKARGAVAGLSHFRILSRRSDKAREHTIWREPSHFPARARGYRPSVCLVNKKKIQIKKRIQRGSIYEECGGRTGRAKRTRLGAAPTARPRRRRARTLRPWPARSGASRRLPRRGRPRPGLPSTEMEDWRISKMFPDKCMFHNIY